MRAGAAGASDGVLRAYDLKGLSVGETRFSFGGANETSARLELPTELRNEIARIEIEGERTAGAVSLLDSRWKRRRVAIVSGVTADVAQPLLSPSYYVARALAPFAEVREPRPGTRDPIIAALDEQPSLLVLTDVGVISGARARQARALRRGRRRAAALRGHAARVRRRRHDAGAPAPRRARARRLAVVGDAAQACAVRPRLALPRHRRERGNRRHAAGSRRARGRPRQQDMGRARRRHAAHHRRPARQGPRRARARHRRHHVVEPAAVGPVRERAAPHGGAGGRKRRGRGERHGEHRRRRAARRDARAHAHARRLRRAGRSARHRKADRGGLQRPVERRSSARLLRPARRDGGDQHARGRTRN